MITDNLKYISQKIASTAHNRFPLHAPDIVSLPGSISLAYLLAGVFEHWSSPAYTRSLFEAELDKFNALQGTNLTFADFESIQWIRTINGRIVLPDVIQSLIRRNINGLQYQTTDKTLQQQFLKGIFDQLNTNRPVLLPKEYLEGRLEHLVPGHKEESIHALLTSGCLTLMPDKTHYSFRMVDPHGPFADELAARLWKASLSRQPNVDTLRDYLQKLTDLGPWPHHISKYLTEGEKRQYGELLQAFFAAEPDLENPDVEYTKVLLDSPSDKHINVDSIPTVSLRKPDPYSLVWKAKSLARGGNNIFIIQNARNIYSLGLNLLIQTDFHVGGHYDTVLSLLKDLERPYLALKLYEKISLNHHSLIPYLLCDLATMPLAFLALEDLDYRPDLISGAISQEERLEEVHKWRQEIRTSLVIEALVYLDLHRANKAGIALACYRLLDILLWKAFSGNLDTRVDSRRHQYYLNEYHHYLDLLANRKISVGNQVHSFPLDLDVIQELTALITQRPVYRRSEFLQLGDRQLYHFVELLKVMAAMQVESPSPKEEAQCLETLQKYQSTHLIENFREYLTETEVQVSRWPGDDLQKRPAKRGLQNLFLDIIDWGYLLLTLESEGQFEIVTGLLTSAITSLPAQGVKPFATYLDDLAEKIKTLLRIFLLAYTRINEHRRLYVILPLDKLLPKLESVIAVLAKQYSGTDPLTQSINLFDNSWNFRINYLYSEDLLSLLFKSVNEGRYSLNDGFVADFFRDSLDLDRMLTAINELRSKKAKDALAAQIEAIDLKKFAATSYPHQLTDTLISAANSDKYWKKIGSPLIARLQKQLARKSFHPGNLPFLLYELRLLLAFKSKSLSRLQKTPFPNTTGLLPGQRQYLFARKEFFVAAFQLYHLKAYDDAIGTLNKIVVENSDNPDFAVHRFRAKTLKAVEVKDKSLLLNAYGEWDAYYAALSDETKKTFGRLVHTISSTKIYYYSAVKEYDAIDMIVRDLPDSYKYDLEIVMPITNALRDRHLKSVALSYITDAIDYHISNGTALPEEVIVMSRTVAAEQDIDALKSTIKSLRNLAPKDIPQVFPDAVNRGNNIEEFILRELVYACKIMVEKIEGIREIKKENRLNDLLMAILRGRFGVWGWEPHEQTRIGTAKGGKDAGSADIVIRQSGDTITVIEGLKIENDPPVDIPDKESHRFRTNRAIDFREESGPVTGRILKN